MGPALIGVSLRFKAVMLRCAPCSRYHPTTTRFVPILWMSLLRYQRGHIRKQPATRSQSSEVAIVIFRVWHTHAMDNWCSVGEHRTKPQRNWRGRYLVRLSPLSWMERGVSSLSIQPFLCLWILYRAGKNEIQVWQQQNTFRACRSFLNALFLKETFDSVYSRDRIDLSQSFQAHHCISLGRRGQGSHT